MSITLFLLNKKAYKSLEAVLADKKYKRLVQLVVVGRDKGNAEDYYEDIKLLCEEHSIPVIDRKKFKNTDSEYSIAIGWRWLILNVQNLIVFHDSLLPKYRGFAPLPNMLINGEKAIGVSTLFATEHMDEGGIIFQKGINIHYPIKIKEAIDLIADLYSSLLLKIFEKISNGFELPQTPQNHSEASYSIWRDSEDYFINWNLDAQSIQRFINAVGFPYDGAKTQIGNEIIRIEEVEIINNLKLEIVHPGKILMFEENNPIIICGQNLLKIKNAYSLDGSTYQFKSLRKKLK